MQMIAIRSDADLDDYARGELVRLARPAREDAYASDLDDLRGFLRHARAALRRGEAPIHVAPGGAAR